MRKTVYKNHFCFRPYSEKFLTEAVLKYQLYLLRKKQLVKRINHVSVLLTIPKYDYTNLEADERNQRGVYIREWFKNQLSVSCRVITRIGECEYYRLDFRYAT